VTRDYYANLLKNGGDLDMEERYGKAITDLQLRNPGAAIPDLQWLVREYPKVTQFYGALGQAYLMNGQLRESRRFSTRPSGCSRATCRSPSGCPSA